MQNDLDSQYTELMSQTQEDLSMTNLDEGEIERDIRELTQNLLERQQELMSAQAEYDRAQSAEQDALSTWEAKRSAPKTIVMLAEGACTNTFKPLYAANKHMLTWVCCSNICV